MNIAIVGAGFSGSVFARLAAEQGHRCTIYESRSHVGGNAWDHKLAGTRVHAYGPHYFRTNNQAVVSFLSRFTQWRHMVYRALARVGDKLVRFPINIGTYEDLYGRKLTVEAWRREMAARQIPLPRVINAEEKLLSRVGVEFYKLFYEGYTKKQWGLHPRQLLPSVVSRVPVYYEDKWQTVAAEFQALPEGGYEAMFERMLGHSGIDVKLSTPWDGDRKDLVVYTGLLDAWFDFREGKLPYRSLAFETKVLGGDRHQPCATVNHPDPSVPYTRTIEWNHLTGGGGPAVVTWEFPKAEGTPFYPMPTEQAASLAQVYRAMAAKEPGVIFLGRLATYRYLDMDHVVLQAMRAAREALSAPVRLWAAP